MKIDNQETWKSFRSFIRKEYYKAMSQRSLLSRLTVLFFFPITSIINWSSYRKWVLLLKIIDVSEANLNSCFSASISVDSISFMEQIKTMEAPSFPSFEMNQCYCIQKEALFIFPIHTPKEKWRYRRILDPFVLSNTSKHPYQTLYNISTFQYTLAATSNDSMKITILNAFFNQKVRLFIELN